MRSNLYFYIKLTHKNVFFLIFAILILVGGVEGLDSCFKQVHVLCLASPAKGGIKFPGDNSRLSDCGRTERPRKTKIGTEVAHVTRDSDTTFKEKSKVKVTTRPLWLPVQVTT